MHVREPGSLNTPPSRPRLRAPTLNTLHPMQAPRKKYRLILEDEARIQTIGSWTLTPARIWISALAVLAAVLAVGFLFVLLTPVKTLIPGYFRASQRAATEQAMLRVDSVMEAYSRNEAYVANLREVFDADRTPRRRDVSAEATAAGFSPDSLMPSSPEEMRFARMMQEREKFNIAVAAPLAAEGMLLYPVSDEGIVTPESRNSTTARLILPEGTSVMAIADGAVLSVGYDRSEHGYAVIMQHDNGFVSRYAGLGSPLIGKGELVSGGQVISLAPGGGASSPPQITVEMWHDGQPLPPYRYISSLTSMPASDIASGSGQTQVP